MTRSLPILFLAAALFPSLPTTPASAGESGLYRSYGYRSSAPCAKSKFQTPRYNQRLPYRHYEDHRRYNAAACYGEVVRPQPYLLETVVIRKERQARYYNDNRGRRVCRHVVVTTYKDFFSDGGCRVYTCKS